MLIATNDTVYVLKGDGSEGMPSMLLSGEGVSCVAEGAGLSAVALDDGTVVLLRDGKERRVKAGVEGSIESLLILGEAPVELVIGTEPPQVYRLAGRARKARRSESFAKLKCREHWYTPWGGPPAVRSLACTGDGWVYADVHVGSIMRSADRGKTWEPVTPELHEDVHQVGTTPASDERVYAETADAFWLSEDRGRSWTHRAADLGERYGRAVAVHPREPDLILATVSDGPHGDDVHGQLYRSEDAGRRWAQVAGGFPASTKENIDTYHVTFSPEGVAWATVDRTLYVGRNRASEWAAFWEAPAPIMILSCRRASLT